MRSHIMSMRTRKEKIMAKKKNSNKTHHKKMDNFAYFANVSGRSAKTKKYLKEQREK